MMLMRRYRWIESLLALVGTGLLFTVPAWAVTFPLSIEFDDAIPGSYGTVEVTENAGDLDFAIDLLLDPADLHEFYFNLVGIFTGVSLTSTDPQTGSAYSLNASPTVAGGAGADFDYGVNFGNGAGPSGNGTLRSATFTISANENLTIANLLQTSSTANGSVVVHVAAHLQGTAFTKGADSETVGGIVPEPATALLVALGMAGLGYARRRAF
jgi:hypothetical protein